MTARRRRRIRIPRLVLTLIALAVTLAGSLVVVRGHPDWAPGVGLIDGLAVGIALGATGLIRSYDDSWDEFWQTTGITYLLGIFAIFVFWIRQESPSAFFWVECVAATISYLMLLFVPPLIWLGADLLLFAGTFIGWLLSGLFRPEYY